MLARDGRGRDARSLDLLLYAVVFLVGVLPVAVELATPHGLYGITEYDDGVYFSAAQHLLAGSLPYRDFVFVQPPGITIVLAPFALLVHLTGGRGALAAARIVTAGVAGANAALVALFLRRYGRLAALVGGLALAVFPTGYTADHTFLLEPYCILFCLIGAIACFPANRAASVRRVALGGAFFALGTDVKTLAIVPLLVAFFVLLVGARRRAASFALGVGIAVAVATLPFLIAAPHAFIHEVVVSQLTRATGRPTPLLNRFFALTGLAYSSGALASRAGPGVPKSAGPTLVASSLLAAVVLLLAARLALRRDRDAAAWFVVLAALGAVVVALGPPAYYDHYAYFSAPFLALALGRAAGLLAGLSGRLVASVRERQGEVVSAAGAIAAVAVLGAAAVLILVPSDAEHRSLVERFGDNGPVVAAAVPPGRCVISDSVNVLVSAGRGGVGPPGCPAIVDPTGTWLSYAASSPPTRLRPPFTHALIGKNPALVAFWSAAFRRADYVVLSGCTAFRIPWTAALLHQFDATFTLVPGARTLVYERRATPLLHLPPHGLPTTPNCLVPVT